MFEIKKSRRVPVFRIYLRAFKQNLKLGLQLGLLELGIVSLSLLDLYLFWGQTAMPFPNGESYLSRRSYLPHYRDVGLATLAATL